MSKLLELPDYLFRLQRAISYFLCMGNIGFIDPRSDFLDWLVLASEMKSIEISPRYTDASMWNSHAYEYEKWIKDYRKEHIFRVSRFVFVWSAFEVFAESTIFPKPGSRGRKGLNKFLASAECSLDNSIVALWRDICSVYACHRDLREDISNPEMDYSEALHVCNLSSLIKVATHYRNKAAHGATSIEYVEDVDSFGLSAVDYLNFVDNCTYATLVVIQYVCGLLVSIGDTPKYVEDLIEFPVCDYFFNLHLKNVDEPDFLYF